MMKRNITADEINKITKLCQPREKAFFTIMRQSGLKPHFIKQLRIKSLEKILEQNTPIPCKIETPPKSKLGKTPNFIGEEGVKYLKQYLATRTCRTDESLLFTTYSEDKEINTKDVSRTFRLAAYELRKKNFRAKDDKLDKLRLSDLIYFYRKNAKHYLEEAANSPSLKDDEFFRELYKEKALPLLETETQITIDVIQRKDNQIRQMKQRIARDSEYISSILTLLYNNKGDYETGENEEIGSNFIELWKETADKQRKNLWDSVQSLGESKLLPFLDIVEELTKTLKRIKKPYDNLERQIASSRADL